MSTKIYNGFRINLTSLPSIHKALLDLRAKLRPLQDAKVKRYVIQTAVAIFDQHTLNYPMPEGVSKHSTPMTYASSDYLKDVRRLKNTMERNPMVDTSFELAIIPVSAKVILGIPYVDDNDFLALLMKQDWVEEYGYWDNTDKPKHLTAREWTARGKMWDKALAPGNDIPAMAGLSADLTIDSHAMFRISPQDVQRFRVPFKKRVGRWVNDICEKHWHLANNTKSKIQHADEDERTMLVFQAHSDYRRAIDTDPIWQKKWSDCKEQIEKKLKPRITRRDLVFTELLSEKK